MVEAKRTQEIAKTVIYPAATRSPSELAATAANCKAAGVDFDASLLKQVDHLIKSLNESIGKLEHLIHEHCHGGHGVSNPQKAAETCAKQLKPAMEAVRSVVDELEGVVADDHWRAACSPPAPPDRRTRGTQQVAELGTRLTAPTGTRCRHVGIPTRRPGATWVNPVPIRAASSMASTPAAAVCERSNGSAGARHRLGRWTARTRTRCRTGGAPGTCSPPRPRSRWCPRVRRPDPGNARCSGAASGTADARPRSGRPARGPRRRTSATGSPGRVTRRAG